MDITNAGNLKFVDKHCSENETLRNLLDKYLNPNNLEEVPMTKQLQFYQSKGIGNLKILLKSEGIKRCKDRFYLLDCSKTLQDNLKGKVIVEFPSIYICYDDMPGQFDIIASDEDVEGEAIKYSESLNDMHKQFLQKMHKNEAQMKCEDDEKTLEKMLNEKKREERQKKREELEKEPGNLLFTDERMWDLLSGSEDGNETEEELVNP